MMGSHGVRHVAAVAVACAFVAGCSVSLPASSPSPGIASGTGSHTESWTRGLLTYTLKWHGTKRGIQIDGLRARYSTCGHVFFFFPKCGRGLVNPAVTFAIYARPQVGQPGKRLWHQDAYIRKTLKPLTAGGTPWLPKGKPITEIFPPGSVLHVALWRFNDWNAVGFGGDQYHRVPGSNGTVILGNDRPSPGGPAS